MSLIYLIRSIALSEETMDAWRQGADTLFVRRDRTPEEQLRIMERNGALCAINLGNSAFNLRSSWLPIVNRAEVVAPLLSPGATRDKLDEFLPPKPTEFPADVWLKAPGRGGKGKTHKILSEDLEKVPADWDVQLHITGKEFRVVTVNDRIVQGHAQTNTDDPTKREYEWTGVWGLPKPVRMLARRAAARLLEGYDEFEEFILVGWDIIWDEVTNKAYLLEGNSCPGVNTATVERIVHTLQMYLEEKEPDDER